MEKVFVRGIENECAEEVPSQESRVEREAVKREEARRVQCRVSVASESRSVVAHVDDLVALEVLDVLLERAHLGLDALLAQLLGHRVDDDGERLVLVVQLLPVALEARDQVGALLLRQLLHLPALVHLLHVRVVLGLCARHLLPPLLHVLGCLTEALTQYIQHTHNTSMIILVRTLYMYE